MHKKNRYDREIGEKLMDFLPKLPNCLPVRRQYLSGMSRKPVQGARIKSIDLDRYGILIFMYSRSNGNRFVSH